MNMIPYKEYSSSSSLQMLHQLCTLLPFMASFLELVIADSGDEVIIFSKLFQVSSVWILLYAETAESSFLHD